MSYHQPISVKIFPELLEDYHIQHLSPRNFKAKFMAAIHGERNEFEPFIGKDSNRPSPARWASIRVRIFSRDNYTCGYCGRRGVRLECDHVIPVSRGGSSDDDNLLTACQPCNRGKRSRTPEEWLA